jgi:hypothetical protein
LDPCKAVRAAAGALVSLRIAVWLACGAGLCLCALCALYCCQWANRGPVVRPEEFVSLRIYDWDANRVPVPEPPRLAGTAHVELGVSRTQRVFREVTYRKPSLVLWKGSYLAVASSAEGEDYRLRISQNMGFFVVNGQPGCYYLEGASLNELAKVLQAALERVFIPARRRKPRGKDATLMPTQIGGKYGYVDVAGTVAIQARFDDAIPFSEGLAAVRVGGPEGGKWGYIDATGNFVIEPQFAGASFFSEGLAAVTVDDFFGGKQGYVDRQGTVVIEPRFQTAWPFADGVATVCIARKELHQMEARCVNAKGELVAPPGCR